MTLMTWLSVSTQTGGIISAANKPLSAHHFLMSYWRAWGSPWVAMEMSGYFQMIILEGLES